MKHALVMLLLLVPATNLHAQKLEARLGVVFSTPLVEDLGANPALADRIPADYTGPVHLKLTPAPVASVGLVQDLNTRASLEVMGGVSIARMRAETEIDDWDVQHVSAATLAASVRYQYWPRVALHGGIGLIRFFSESSGIFSEGSSVLPLLELGTSTTIPLGALPLRAGVRLQTHTFGTPALRRDGATDGRIVRILIQAGIGG